MPVVKGLFTQAWIFVSICDSCDATRPD
jgi:hypothetical protein